MKWLRDGGDGGASEAMMERARELLHGRKRVWWVTLPSARNRTMRRLAAGGGLLGVEVAHFQRVRQRILAQTATSGRFISSGMRVARVAAALEEVRRGPPRPGEARLFASAIAELKRFEVGPEDVPLPDAEAEALAEVYRTYERIKGEELDPDDVARLAVDLVASGRWRPEADAVFVAGFWEIAPVTFSLLMALEEKAGLEVWVSLPEPPDGAEPTPALPAEVSVWRAENPVHELRWLLAQIKRDLLVEGRDPLELALVVPPARLEAVKMLAREYDLYLMDETYHGLAEEEAGKLLVDLLSFADHPTAEGLFLFPELAPLGRAALSYGLAGHDALGKLAEQLDEGGEDGLAAALERILRELDPTADLPEDEDEARRHVLAWAEDLLAGRPQLAGSPWRDAFMLRAREALEAGGPHGFRRWWLGMLQRVRAHARQRGGVALLTQREVSGRRYQRAYVLGAVEGAYTVSEREDYFIAEEARHPWPEVFARIYKEKGVLPRHLRGRDVLLWRRLRNLADEVIITYPEADAGQPLKPELDLVKGVTPQPMGEAPLVSRALSRAGGGWRASNGGLPLPPPRSLNGVYSFERHFGGCGFRAWLETQEGLLPEEPYPERGWYYWLSRLSEAARRGEEPPAEALAAFRMSRAEWQGLTFFPSTDFLGVPVYVHAGAREGRVARIYRFGDEGIGEKEARKLLRERWAEFIFAGRYLDSGYGVELWFWPHGERPLLAYSAVPGKDSESWLSKFGEMIERSRARARKALERYGQASVEPQPGWHCRNCPFADICRKEEL